MKKGLFVVLLLIICIVVCLYPVTQNSTINISATFENTANQVIHVEDWKNWYPEIKEIYQTNPRQYRLSKDLSKKIDTVFIPGKKIIINIISPMSYQINEVSDNSENNFAFTVFPSESTHSTSIFLIQKRPFISKVLNGKKTNENPLNGLKVYLEDPKELYGFDIKMAEIRDPIIASTVFRIPKKDIFQKIRKADTLLRHYIGQKKLIKTGHISISYIPVNADSLQVTVGIPVDKLADSMDGINCLSLPVKGRVLVGNYEGKFSERRKIYSAMTKYLTDHGLSIPAESFERYLNDSVPLNDSSEIKIELDYPVY